MMWKQMVFVLVVCFCTGPLALASGQLMPPHPDLIKKLGTKEAGRLYQSFATPPGDIDPSKDIQVQGARITGTGTCLTILWDFVDHPADQLAHPTADFHELLFSVGTHPTGSMNDYYQEVSYGTFAVSGLVVPWTTAANSYASYAHPDGSQDSATCQTMLIDAIAQLDPFIDFSLYDNDGPDGMPSSGDDDGIVDALFMVHAGAGMEESGDPNDIWSHAWGFDGGLPTNDGVIIFRYSVEPERMVDGTMVSLGVFAHEYGHILGLPDLYDTDSSSSGIGEWDLMSGGGWTHRPGDPIGTCPTHLSAWNKTQLGWLTPVEISVDTPGLVIPPVETQAIAYRVFRAGEAGGPEYFLMENRRPIGFDAGLTRRQINFNLAQPEGLVIYHVDETMDSNSNEKHRLVDVVDASPWFHPDGTWHENHDGLRELIRWGYLDAYNKGDNGDVWPGFTTFNADSTNWTGPRDRNSFNDQSIPPALDYECNATGVTIGNIIDDGLNVTTDILVSPPLPRSHDVARTSRTWDFETHVEDLKFCNSYAHFDQSQAEDCPGEGGLWFGSNQWDCPGYGNNWEDFAWVTVTVKTAENPMVSLRHKYDLEPGFDFAYLEARPSAVPTEPWTQLAMFNGSNSCNAAVFPIPQSVLNAGNQNGLATIDVRLRLSSDAAWSAEDGLFCGSGWWIDELAISEMMITGTDEFPAMGNVAHLAAPMPNPFNPSTVLKYHLPVDARQVRLAVFDQRGHQIRELAIEPGGGWHEIRWDGRSDGGRQVASGLYFAKLMVNGQASVQKMALVK